MEISQEEVLELLRLVDESHFAVMHLELGDLRLEVRKTGDTEMQGSSAYTNFRSSALAEKPLTESTGKAEEHVSSADQSKSRDGLVVIEAPMLGLFYRSPAPAEPPYVEVGDEVNEDDTVALIEVMKLFTAVKAGTRGRIVSVCAEAHSLVQYGQELFLVQPSDDANDIPQLSSKEAEM